MTNRLFDPALNVVDLGGLSTALQTTLARVDNALQDRSGLAVPVIDPATGNIVVDPATGRQVFDVIADRVTLGSYHDMLANALTRINSTPAGNPIDPQQALNAIGSVEHNLESRAAELSARLTLAPGQQSIVYRTVGSRELDAYLGRPPRREE